MSGYPFQARPMIGVPQRYPTNSNPIHYPNPNLVHHDNTFQSPRPPPPPMPPQREGFLGIYQNPNPNLNSNPRALDGKYPLLPQEEIMRRDADVWHHKRERDFQNDRYGSDLCHGQNSLPEWGERNLYDSHPPSYGREFGLQQTQNKSFLPRHGNQFRVQGNQNEYFLSRVENPVGMPRMDSNIEEELLWKQPHKRIRIDARGNTQEIDGAGLPITDGRQNSSYSGNWHGELVLRNREDTFREDRVSMVGGPSREEELLLEHGLMEDRDAEKRRQEAQIEAERRNRFDAENPNRFDNDRYGSLDNRGHRFQEDSMRDLSNGSGARDFASSQRYSDFVNCKEGNRMPSHFPSHDYMNFQNNQTKRPQNGYLESRPSSDQSMYLGNEMHTYSLHHDREARNERSRDDDIIDKLHSDFVQRQRQKLTSQSYISDSQSMLGNDRGVGSVQHFQVEPNDRFVEPHQHIKAYNSMENVQNNIHNERWNEVAHNSTYAKAQHQGIVGQEQVTSRNQFEDSDAVRDWHSEKLNFPVHETQLQAKTPYERFLNQESYDLDRPFQSEYNHSLFNQKHKSSHMIEVGPNCRSSPIPNGNEFQTCNRVPESATFQRQHAQSPEHTRFPPFQLSEQMPQPSNPPQSYNNAKVPSILPVTQLPGGSNVQSQHPPQPYYPHPPPPNSMPMSSNVQGELPQLPPPVPLAPPPPLPSSPPPPSPKRSSLPFIPHEVSPRPPVSSNFSSGPTSVPLLPTNMKSFPESKMAQGQGYPFQPAPVQHGPGFVSTGSQVIVHIPFQKFGEVDHPFSAKRLQDEKPRFIDAVNIFKDPGRASRPDRFVVILRGLPGSGKSYLAKALRDIEVGSGGSAPRIHSMDDYFMTEVEKDEENEVGIASSLYRSKKRVTKTVMEYCYEPEMEEAYRASMLKAFKKTVEEGSFTFVIVDDRNLRVADFAQFWATAKRSGYEVYLLEAPYKDPAGCAARNVHSFTSDKVQEMANRWEDAPPLYLQLNISSLIHTDELDARGITEVEMDTDEADLKTENHDVTIVMEKGQAGLASDRPIQIESINSQGRWTSEEDSDIKYEKKGFLRSKWSDTKDNDNEFVEQSKKEDSNALSGLMQIYGKGDKSVRWADQADKDRGFSIGIKARNKSSLIIGPGAGYNEVSNPIAQEDKDSPPRGNDSSGNVKKSRKIWEQLRAEQESFKAVFDRRRHRIGGMKEDDD